jgi:hypothetical protein
MAISGHKTRAIFDRYNIVSEADLADAVNRLERVRLEGAPEGALALGKATSDSAKLV